MSIIEIILWAFFIPGYLFLFFVLLLLLLYPFNRYRKNTYIFGRSYRPFISLIVPAHNEEDVIEKTLQAFLATDYDPTLKEIIIVNDGSVDRTGELIKQYASTVIENGIASPNETNFSGKNIILVNREIGGNGKAQASNDGAKYARGEILFFTDADVRIEGNSFLEAVKHFSDERVGAVAGNVEITQNESPLNGFLIFESILAQKVTRSSFNVLGFHYIVPGGCAIFRKKVWESVGGYRVGGLAEDTDLTWKILTETNKEIRFDSSISVLADEPKTLQSLWNQRVRWSRGNIEVMANNKYKIGKGEYGKGATYGFPFWLTSISMPLIFILNMLGAMFAAAFGFNTLYMQIFGSLLALTFFVQWTIGVIVGKGKGALEGLLSPGLVFLLVLTSSIIWPYGFNHSLFSKMLLEMGFRVGRDFLIVLPILFVLSAWILTYVMVRISPSHKKFAETMQLVIIGYWLLIMASTLHGYALEIMGKEKKWIRTVR